jgi:hypothetical protein
MIGMPKTDLKKPLVPAFEEFCAPLIGLPVNNIWQGYGSAIFLEFGRLEIRRRRDGSPGNPRGEWGLMMEWSWRIEGKRRIWCGSWSDGARWPRAFACLLHAKVASVSLVGRLPEIDIGLSNGLHILSMMTRESDPEWALFNRQVEHGLALFVKAGRLMVEENLPEIAS